MKTSSSYLTPERVNRQRRVLNQELLDNCVVGIRGSSLLAQITDLCMYGLGVGGVVREEKNPFLESLGLTLQSPYQRRGQDMSLADIIIDCDNIKEDNNYLVVPEFFLGTNTLRKSIVGAGVLGMNLIRRLHDEPVADLESVAIYDKPLCGRALVVGAGGTGTYASLCAATCGLGVDVIDFDTIEAHNLNRQVLYGKAVGSYKADVLSQTISLLGATSNSFVDKISKNNVDMISGYDVVFSCLDNVSSRKVLSDVSKESGICLVDGGVSALTGRVHAYYPEKTRPLSEQISLVEQKKKKALACYEASPSTIMPNMVIGALMVEHYAQQAKRPFRYDGRNNAIYEDEVTL